MLRVAHGECRFRYVGNAYAQEILDELGRIARLPSRGSDAWFPCHGQRWFGEDYEYIADRLDSSGLVSLIPGGTSHLPNILESTSPLLRSLTRMAEPRSYRQLARHLAQHLNWYLQEQEHPLATYRFGVPLTAVSILTSLPIIGFLLFKLGGMAWDVDGDLLLQLFKFVMGTGLLLWVAAIGVVAIPVTQLRAGQRDRLHAQALYFYLLEALSEPQPQLASHSNALSQGNVNLTEAANS